MEQATKVFWGLWSLGVLCLALGFVEAWREQRKRERKRRERDEL